MVFDHEWDHPSGWATLISIAEKMGCVSQTLHEWIKRAKVHSGKRDGVPTEVADNVKAPERKVRELRPANEILRKAFAYFTKMILEMGCNEQFAESEKIVSAQYADKFENRRCGIRRFMVS